MCTVRKSRVKNDAGEWGKDAKKRRKEGKRKRGRRSEDNKF